MKLRYVGFATAIVYALLAVYHGWRPPTPHWRDDVVAWMSVAGLLLLYLAGYAALKADSSAESPRRIVAFALLLIALTVLTIPFDSTDVFLYVGMGWAQARYGLSPYANVLHDIPNVTVDPMIGAEWMVYNKNPWLDLPLVYGPLFAAFLRAVALAGQGNWWLTLLLLKLANVAAYSLTAWLIWSTGRRLGHERPECALYLFMWNPLILLHHIANGHNDLLMGCLVLFAYRLLITGRLLWAPSVLATAGMVKYLALVLVPLALVSVIRERGWRAAAWSGALTAGTIAVITWPYVGRIAEFEFELIGAQLGKITAGSLFAALYYTWRAAMPFVGAVLPLEAFGSALRILLSLGSVVALSLVGYRFCRSKDLPAGQIAVVWTLFLFLLIFGASSQFYAWYIGMLLPIALVLTPGHPLRAFIVLLSATHMVSFTSISRKAIGYFLAGTGSASILWRFRDQLSPKLQTRRLQDENLTMKNASGPLH